MGKDNFSDGGDYELLERVGMLDSEEVQPYISRDVSLTTDEKVRLLVAAGILTEKQAEAYVYRVVEGIPREEAAEKMEIGPTTMDDHRGAALDKISQVEMTSKVLELLDEHSTAQEDSTR